MTLLNHFGPEFVDHPELNALHKLYISLFGIPISGLRIRLRRILPEISGDFRSIIDLGCGKGIFTMELARRYPNATVLGIDTDAKQVEINTAIAKKRGLTNVKFAVQDILTMPYENQFDLALSVDNLEHIQDDVDALRRISRSLTKGGTLVCHVPAYERIWLFRKLSTNFDVEGHVRPGYRTPEFKEKILSAGFKISTLKPTYGYLETISNNISYLITGASQKNAAIYAVIFPLLNFIAWLGRRQDPKDRGAGVLALARKAA
jgi:SAM-dependent methyltransferase